MSVQTQIERITEEVGTQKDLISQISSVLAGKASGGNGIVPEGTKTITQNGTHDVTSYASAEVNVPGIVPTGTMFIDVNGMHDVTEYANVAVNVPYSGGLPAGISKMTTGSIVPTSDVSSALNVTHDLGAQLDVFALFADVDNLTLDSEFNGYILSVYYASMRHTYNSSNYTHYMQQIRMQNGSLTSSAGRRSSSSTTTIAITADSSSKLKAGVTYRWVAISFE